jgi:ribosomal protein L7/L12
MRPLLDYSKDLRRKLAEGKSFDEALIELRSAGISIFDAIASVRALHRCDLAEAKRLVENSSAWSDRKNICEEIVQELGKMDEKDVA